jgi:DNA-binding transcriptional regulator YhcF (GntR family)
MEKRKPGIEKAVDFLKNKFISQQCRTKLPPIRLLASAAQVSFVTMWRAVNFLKGKGLILGSKTGHANYVRRDAKRRNIVSSPAQADIQLDAESKNVLWQKVATHIKKDILSGIYAYGQPLPSSKELQHRYGVSFRTLKKSLDTLTSEEMIKPYKRGYIVPAITTSDANARVVAIGCGWKDGKIWADYQDKNYFRILESECIQSKIALDVIVYWRQDNHLCFVHSATRKPYDLRNDTILGIVYIIANLEVDPEEMLRELSVLKKPVAVLDVVGWCSVSPLNLLRNRFMQFFTTTASTFPAKVVAQYLLSLKHTHIAFISPFHKAPWSKIRYKSCAAVYRDAGFPDGVKPFLLDRYAYQWDYLQDPKNSEGLLSIINQYAQWKEFVHSRFFRKFGNISYSISKYLTEWNCASGEIYKAMRLLFEKALRDKHITAWLMANDFAATLALDYLKDKKIRVPEDISIIAFDNTLDAMEYQLTSYDFNNNGIVTMMLRYVLAPSTIPVNQRGKFVEVEGTIVVRRSTAPARKA